MRALSAAGIVALIMVAGGASAQSLPGGSVPPESGPPLLVAEPAAGQSVADEPSPQTDPLARKTTWAGDLPLETLPAEIRNRRSPVSSYGDLRHVDVDFTCDYRADGRAVCRVDQSAAGAMLIDRTGEWMAFRMELHPDFGAMGVRRKLTVRFPRRGRFQVIEGDWSFWSEPVDPPLWRTSPSDVDQALLYSVYFGRMSDTRRLDPEIAKSGRVELTCPVLEDGWLGICRTPATTEADGFISGVALAIAANVRLADADAEGASTAGRHINLSLDIVRPDVLPEAIVVEPTVVSTPGEQELAALTSPGIVAAGAEGSSVAMCISTVEYGPPANCAVIASSNGDFSFSPSVLGIVQRRLIAPGTINGQPYRLLVKQRVIWR